MCYNLEGLNRLFNYDAMTVTFNYHATTLTLKIRMKTLGGTSNGRNDLPQRNI